MIRIPTPAAVGQRFYIRVNRHLPWVLVGADIYASFLREMAEKPRSYDGFEAIAVEAPVLRRDATKGEQ